MMRAIILAESSQCDLSPLTDHVPHPLLPLAGKSILLHALEALHRSSIRNVEIVAPTLHGKLEEAIDTRPILGMKVEFRPRMLDLRHSEEHCLIIGLSDLVDIDWNDIFDQLSETDNQTVFLRMPEVQHLGSEIYLHSKYRSGVDCRFKPAMQRGCDDFYIPYGTAVKCFQRMQKY
jgi:hypothetical protein